MAVNIDAIYQTTLERYNKAKFNIQKRCESFSHSNKAISDVIPDYSADKLEFGSYDKENFAVLFVDMRDSTMRAEKVGAEKTFLTMHVYLTALLEVVKHYHGKVIDIMGDGIMVFWGGKAAREVEQMYKQKAIQNAGLCGRDMLRVREPVINRIISDESLGAELNYGIGVTFDSVIVTKIGIHESYDVKAFGTCINKAYKYASKANNKVKVSKKVKNEWPTGDNGTISFVSAADGDGYYLKSNKI